MSARADRRARIATARLFRSDRDGGDNGGMPPDLDVRALEASTSEISVDTKALIQGRFRDQSRIAKMLTTF